MAGDREIKREEFDKILESIIVEEGSAIFVVPGIYEVLAEHYNNIILATWETEKHQNKWDKERLEFIKYFDAAGSILNLLMDKLSDNGDPDNEDKIHEIKEALCGIQADVFDQMGDEDLPASGNAITCKDDDPGEAEPLYTMEFRYYENSGFSCVHGSDKEVEPAIWGAFSYLEATLMRKCEEFEEWLDREHAEYDD